jgi:hypothetical protein
MVIMLGSKKSRWPTWCLGALIALVFTLSANAGEIRVIAWNLESGGSDPDTVADEIAEFDGYHLWGLSEVTPSAISQFAAAAAVGEDAEFEQISGTTGAGDRLMLVWNADVLEWVAGEELLHLRLGGGRAPLAARFREIETDIEFWAVVNHLHRKLYKNKQQSEGLNDWVAGQEIPVLVFGDMNYDMELSSEGEIETVRESFELLMADEILVWVEPEEKFRTEDSHNSILDFAFVTPEFEHWNPVSTIIVRPDDFTDVSDKTDHRPINCVFTTSDSVPTPPLTPIPVQPLALGADAPTGEANLPRHMPQGVERESASLSTRELLQLQLEAMRHQLNLLELTLDQWPDDE